MNDAAWVVAGNPVGRGLPAVSENDVLGSGLDGLVDLLLSPLHGGVEPAAERESLAPMMGQ